MAAYAAPASPRPSRGTTSYETFAAITPADNTQIGPYTALYCAGTGGTVKICPRNSATAITINIASNGFLPIAFQGIDATGTSATNLVGLA